MDGAARPDFDGAESHRLYLQLLGCTNASKDSFEEGRVWERHNASPEAEERLAHEDAKRVFRTLLAQI